jgi:hypothetical protein
MPGRAELARIHILKKEAALTDDEYRSLLSGAAGVLSAADIETPDQYYKVVFALEKYLLSIGRLPSGRAAAGERTLAEVILDRAKRILGPGWQSRLSGYLRKMGRADLSRCSGRELRRVMGFLSSIEKSGAKPRARPEHKNKPPRQKEGRP